MNEKNKISDKQRIPFASIKMNKHKMFVQGGSWIVSVPPPFAKAIEILQDRRLRSFCLNSYLIYEYEKSFHKTEYDLLQIALDCLSAIYYITDDEEAKKIIEDVYEKATILQEYLE